MIKVRIVFEDPAPVATSEPTLGYTAVAIDASTGEPLPGMRGNGGNRDDARLQLARALDRSHGGDWEWDD